MKRKRGHNEGSYYQRSNGKWRAQVTIDGKRLSHEAKTRQEVIQWLDEKRSQIRGGLTYKGTQTSLEEFLDNWLTSVKPSLRQSTWIHYNHLVQNFIKPALGSYKMKDLRPDLIQAFYDHLLKEGTGEYTIVKTHAVMLRSLGHAQALKLLPYNPAEAVIVPSPQKREMRILDENQVSTLLLAVKGTRMEALIHLAVHTGMREMELLGLKWEDLDWEGKILWVRRQLARKQSGKPWEFAPPKTKYGKRQIVLGTRVIDTLREHHERQQLDRQLAKQRWKEYGLIFPTKVGTPMHPRNMLDDFKKVLRDAGLPNIRFHDLRHTAASLMLNHNVPVIVVSRRLGHSRPSITLDLYGHLIPSAQAEAAELMDQLISPIEIDIEV